MSKLTRDEQRALRAVVRKRPAKELKPAFALIRSMSDRALLAALAPRKRGAPRRDPLTREITQMLKPLMAPAQEKAELLVNHIARQRRKRLRASPKGLADAVRQLRAEVSDEHIRAGAASLLGRLAKLHGDKESVV